MENTNTERLNPLNDTVFSCIFADDSTKIAMLEIINAVLLDAGDEPIKQIIRMKSQYGLIAENVGAKGGRLDVRAEAEDGELFDIEVQLYTDIINDRSWFYGSKLMSDAFQTGETYKQVPRVRVINLLGVTVRNSNDDILQPIGVMYKKPANPPLPPLEVASDAFRIYNIELTKFRARYETLESVGNDPLLRWLYLFDRGYKDVREMEVLTEMTEGMRAFAKKYNRSLNDPMLRGLYELDLSARRDNATMVQVAEERGEARGREEGISIGEKRGISIGEKRGISIGEKRGRLEAQTALIKNMLRQKLPIDLIYQCVDAPKSDIDAIIANYQ